MKINKRTSTDVRFEVELNHCANLDFLSIKVPRKTSGKYCSQEGIR